MTFNIEKLTYIKLFEGNILIYDISLQYWNPQHHYDNTITIPEEPNDSDSRKIR